MVIVIRFFIYKSISAPKLAQDSANQEGQGKGY